MRKQEKAKAYHIRSVGSTAAGNPQRCSGRKSNKKSKKELGLLLDCDFLIFSLFKTTTSLIIMDTGFKQSDQSPSDAAAFLAVIRQRHERVSPCFMTGKGCVYTDQIDQALDERKKLDGACSGFMIMPFRPKLKVFFQNCLQPFFQANYGSVAGADTLDARESRFSLTRADDVSRPGIIICEGICKRIQESDFVIADISVPNDNVFYELGLAYGIGQKIALIHQRGAQFGQLWAKYLRADESARADSKVKEYDNLEIIKRENFKVSQYFWKRPDRARAGKSTDPRFSSLK